MLTTTSTDHKETRRVWPKSRRKAFAIWKALNLQDEGKWHVGVSSDRIVMLDLDCPDIGPAYVLARYVKELLGGEVAIFRTGRGWHLISSAVLGRRELWKSAMARCMGYCDIMGIPLDYQHVVLSLLYENAVLRITPKNGTGTPQLEDVV